MNTMFEDSVSAMPSIWASLIGWFTPTVLFVLLNVVIGTIALTSTLSNRHQQQHQQTKHDPNNHNQYSLSRSPSVLQRLRSINFYAYKSHVPYPPIATNFNPIPNSDSHYPPQHDNLRTLETEPQHVFQETHYREETGEKEEENEEEARTMDEVYSRLTNRHVSRTRSDTEPASGEASARLPATMRKSASFKSAFGHFKEDDVIEARRPATVRERKVGFGEADEEVDAKADDFINRFKQQLKLQRLDSILRKKN